MFDTENLGFGLKRFFLIFTVEPRYSIWNIDSVILQILVEKLSFNCWRLVKVEKIFQSMWMWFLPISFATKQWSGSTLKMKAFYIETLQIKINILLIMCTVSLSYNSFTFKILFFWIVARRCWRIEIFVIYPIYSFQQHI